MVNLILTGIWVSMKGGDAGLLIWGSVPLFHNWLAAFFVVQASAIWMSPFVAWFLFVSAWTKRAPLLMAFMPLILIPLLEWIFLRTRFFAFEDQAMNIDGIADLKLGRIFPQVLLIN